MAVPADIGEGYDFAIGDQRFHLAISDERKYERATAQFRKEQFDSSPTVGDASLTGWWTRGQLTFHHGGGVRYYDVLDETVVNRFDTSSGLNVRTPGKATLLPAPIVVNTTIVDKLVSNRIGRSEGYAAITEAGAAVLLDGAATTALTTSTASSAIYDVAHGHQRTFYATAGGVDEVPEVGTTLTLAWGNVAADIFGFPVGVWFAKGRLFIVTSSGKWFAQSTTMTGTLADADSFWLSGLSQITTGYNWVLADSPGPVYMAFGDTVFAVTPEGDGLVPTLTAGKTVMQLPNDEYVVDMAFGPGHLVISTNKGVRVAVTDESGGLSYGPHLFTGNGVGVPGSAVAFQGSVAYVTGYWDSPLFTEVRSIDLSRPIDGESLVYAWATEYAHASSNTRVAVAGGSAPLSTGGGRYYMNADGVLAADGSGLLPPLMASGELTTGYHRFGTLEPKKFSNVSVRLAGSGTVAVSKVLADGTETLLDTIDVSTTVPDTISLGIDAPAEMLALKFTLTRNATDTFLGPELLGYQIRALPAPLRQRLIRVPLMLHDVERRGVTRPKGYKGSAWERLSALEAMEEDGGTFDFTDYRTGETGTCYIEQISHEGGTPPGRQDTGFGGILWVTLRKL